MSLASCRIHGRIIVDFYFISCIFIKFIQFFLLFRFHGWNCKDNLLNFIICKFFYGHIIFCPYRDSLDLSTNLFLTDINKASWYIGRLRIADKVFCQSDSDASGTYDCNFNLTVFFLIARLDSRKKV